MVPPAQEKRYWQRYIYLWINYALWEELEADDPQRTREVYRAALKTIPHSHFTFAKVWMARPPEYILSIICPLALACSNQVQSVGVDFGSSVRDQTATAHKCSEDPGHWDWLVSKGSVVQGVHCS